MNSGSPKINAISRLSLAFVFFYHGLIPKILIFNETERKLIEIHDISTSQYLFSSIFGALEILLALFIVLYRKSLFPIYIAATLLVLLLIDVAIVMPELLVQAFNPVSINLVSLSHCYLILLSQSKIQ